MIYSLFCAAKIMLYFEIYKHNSLNFTNMSCIDEFLSFRLADFDTKLPLLCKKMAKETSIFCHFTEMVYLCIAKREIGLSCSCFNQ